GNRTWPTVSQSLTSRLDLIPSVFLYKASLPHRKSSQRALTHVGSPNLRAGIYDFQVIALATAGLMVVLLALPSRFW
ncbi:MAG: hypothetical protein ACE1ZA_22280, partial [Pseudomonadales bacterium]